MYRMTVNPVDEITVRMILEEIKPIGSTPKLISRCEVTFKPGVTSYHPVPGDENFGQFPKIIDEEIRNRLRAYQDGRNQEQHYSWLDDEESEKQRRSWPIA
jgi:hypothetical protein